MTDAASIEQRPEIPGYRLERRIGEGGMAQVWLATQLSLDRPVGVKVLAAAGGVSNEMAARFEREARMIAKLDHPRIVGIYDVGRTRDGRMYYSMPFLNNGDLSRRDLRYAPQEIVRVMRALLDALEYAHRHNVVHRDVKPANILFDKNDRPLLADFGIALSRGDGARMTSQRQTLGSTGYMSPEQARSGDVDGRADLYSLGVVCYELLTGDLPYRGADPLAIAIAHVEEPIPRLPPTLRVWQPWIDKALAKDPEARFQDAKQMREGLAAVERRLARLEVQLPPPSNRRASLLAVLALVLAAGGAWWTLRDLPGRNGDATDAKPIAPAAAITTLDAARIDALLVEAGERLKQGRAVLPEDDNAAQRYLEILRAAPASSEARDGLDRAIATAAQQASRAIADGKGVYAAELYDAAYGAAEGSGIPDYPAWADFSKRYVAAVGDALDGAVARLDRDVLERIGPAYDRAAMNAPALEPRRARVAALPDVGRPIRDANGATVAIVPAQRGDSRVASAFALGVNEVTRGEYAQFARATGRAASRCRDAGGPLAMMRRPTWESPGFNQRDDEPVVCVTADDARAYAAWLAQKSGLSYRLPTREEWRHAAAGLRGDACRVGNLRDASTDGVFARGKRYECNDGAQRTTSVGRFAANSLGLRDLAGNVAEWLGDCARAKNPCTHRFIAGSSYRDGPESPLAGPPLTRDGSAAATDIGFRVARDL